VLKLKGLAVESIGMSSRAAQPEDATDRTGELSDASALSWDDYFYAIAEVVLQKSKDQDRKVGAVVTGEGNVILSTGFNGFARGIRETKARYKDAEKLLWITHAETNAIFNAARAGVPLVGGTLYATTYPCAGCAQAIVQAGIVRVFTRGGYWIKTANSNRYDIAPAIFAEAGVVVDAPRIRDHEVEFWTKWDAERREREASAADQKTRDAASSARAARDHQVELERLAAVGRRFEEQQYERTLARRQVRAPLRPVAKAALTAKAPRRKSR
jgi:dCMP deaminase